MIINSITKKWLDACIKNPRSSIFIDTKNDLTSGLKLAQYIHDALISNRHEMIVIKPEDDKIIRIETIREIQHLLATSADRSEGLISRIVCLYDAQKMSLEAQNALLKILEELPKRTIVIFIGDSTAMLKTILSRCFLVPLLPITHDQAVSYAKDTGIASKKAEQFYLLSDGSLSTFEYYLVNGTEGNEEIQRAKKYLAAKPHERLRMHAQLTKDKKEFRSFLATLALISKSAMRNTQSTEQKKQWKDRLAITLTAIQKADENVNARLLALNLSIRL